MNTPEQHDISRHWWGAHPMTYERGAPLAQKEGSVEWFAEIDRRFLSSAYYARRDGIPFGRFLRTDQIAGRRVLEVGCGMGTHAQMLARVGARLTAIDLTARAAAMTRKRLAVAGLPGNVEQADAERLPFPDASFDVVWSWGVIHHSASTDRCLDEITRVLVPGGRLVLMVYYRPSLVYYVHAGLIRGILGGGLLRRSLQEIYVSASDGAYARVFTMRELRSLLGDRYSDARFTVVGLKAELWPIPRCRLKTWLERLTPDAAAQAILGRVGSMLVVEATRCAA